jgi:hypothetical protein
MLGRGRGRVVVGGRSGGTERRSHQWHSGERVFHRVGATEVIGSTGCRIDQPTFYSTSVDRLPRACFRQGGPPIYATDSLVLNSDRTRRHAYQKKLLNGEIADPLARYIERYFRDFGDWLCPAF